VRLTKSARIRTMRDSSASLFSRVVLRSSHGRTAMGSPQPPRVRWSNMWACDLLLLAGLAWLAPGCLSDECRRGEVRCNDNRAQSCDFASSDSDRLEWLGTDCGTAFCKLSNDPASPKPFCAQSADPDPRCAASTYFEFCDGNQVIGCHQGYVEHTVDCQTGRTFGPGYWMSPMTIGECVAQESAALCVLSATPNPVCPTDTVATVEWAPFRSVCDGNQVLTCFYEYVASVDQTCPASGACVAAESTEFPPFCALENTVDPQCPASAIAGAQPSFCRNDAIEFCESGWVTREEPCESGTRCVDAGGGFSYCQAN